MGEGVRVVGVGNPDRGDDGVGPAVAAAIRDAGPSDLEVVVSTADPTRLIDAWQGAGVVLVVDAVVGQSDPGTITVIDPASGALPADAAAVSSHGMGVAAAVELARSLGRLPDHLTVVGVTGQSFEGAGLSDRVRRAVPAAAAVVLEVARDA